MTYDNIKSHKKPGLHLFSEKYIFEKTTVRGQIDLSLVVLRLKPTFLLIGYKNSFKRLTVKIFSFKNSTLSY